MGGVSAGDLLDGNRLVSVPESCWFDVPPLMNLDLSTVVYWKAENEAPATHGTQEVRSNQMEGENEG